MNLDKTDISCLLKETIDIVYSHFNGRINSNDPITRLVVSEGYIGQTSIIARTSPCNYIYISIPAFIQSMEDKHVTSYDQVRNLALEVIIHELTHADQLIDPKWIKNNKEYRDSIEEECIREACRFILVHVDELRAYGLYVDTDYFFVKMNSIKDVSFTRKYHDLVVPYRLETIIGPQFKKYNANDIILLYNNKEIKVRGNNQYINSIELIDALEAMHIDKTFDLHFKLSLPSLLVIKVSQGE